VYLKREDLQIVRSYKLRGAYNMMSLLPSNELAKGVVCASAGNHAQGFAYSCKKLNVQGVVFMPIITPNQKVSQTKMFGEGFVEVKLVGDTFDDCAVAAKKYTEEHSLTFIPPFDNIRIIEGQSTVGIEILEEQQNIDFVFLPVLLHLKSCFQPNKILTDCRKSTSILGSCLAAFHKGLLLLQILCCSETVQPVLLLLVEQKLGLQSQA
jgi:hypothetical protein